jgi:hypothetical protein
MALPQITNSAYLVLGASPHEDRGGRDFYDMDTIYLLSNMHRQIGLPNSAYSRYIQADFNNPQELGPLSERLEGQFDEIAFDGSTIKLFNIDSPERPLVERLVYLKNMLKNDGKIYFVHWNASPGGGWFALPGDPYYETELARWGMGESRIIGDGRRIAWPNWDNRFKYYLTRAGFRFEESTAGDIHTSVLVPLLYTGNNFSHDPNQIRVLVAQKTPDMNRFRRNNGGARHKRTKRHRRNRRQTRMT